MADMFMQFGQSFLLHAKFQLSLAITQGSTAEVDVPVEDTLGCGNSEI